MTVFVAVILAMLTFAFIFYPLFKQKSHSFDSGGDEEIQELYSRRDTTYSTLKELEFDFQSGILTDEDYRELEARYKRNAISILKDIDNVKKGTKVEEEIERQVQELRQSRGQFCPKCSTSYQKGDRFCHQCGKGLSQGGDID